MKKTYLKPRIKTLDVLSENVLNMTSVNDQTGDGHQLGKETDYSDQNDWGMKRTNVWE